jgi:hypothetical protein
MSRAEIHWKMAIFCASVAQGFMQSGMVHEAAAMYRAAGTFANGATDTPKGDDDAK